MLFESLDKFVDGTPNARFCVLNIAKELDNIGFVQLDERVPWIWDEPTEYVEGFYVIRGGSIIAFRLPEELCSFAGTITHTDSPNFRIKTNPEILNNGYVKLNVEPYGGAIYYSWLDKPLAICGTVIDGEGIITDVDTKGQYEVFIPSQAIHISREVNNKNPLNPQKDMLPVFALSETKNFMKTIEDLTEARNGIRAMDLSLYNPEPVRRLKLPGTNQVTMGPRLDNLASVYAALKAFIDSCNDKEMETGSANVFVAFNSEEIGSATYDGADGTFLTTILERICESCNADKYPIFASSTFINIDAAHAVHPNAAEKSDPTNIIKMGDGVVIKHNDNYASNIELEAWLKLIARNNHVAVQDFYSKSDMRCGSTLGNISMGHHGIKSIDIGIPMLAMHSAVETINMSDVYSLETLLYYYYKYV